MKDFVQIWSRVTGRRYSAVNTTDRELKELSNNRLKKGDIDTSAFEANFSECEGLNSRYDDLNERRDDIINRLFERRRKGQRTRQPKCLFILLMVGFCAIATGCLIMFLKPYDFLFEKKVIFSDGGEIFEMWKKPEVDLYVRIYLFNVTNAEEFMNGTDAKLKLEEVGPYVYKEALEHEIVQFNGNGTLSAIPRHPLAWMEDLSKGRREDDVLYLPHIALLSIANVVSQQSFVTRFGLNNLIALTKSQPLVKMTAREFMMGYESNLMTLGNTFMPGWITFDKLGLIDRMYEFEGDYETIFTGETNIRDSGLIDTYKGSTDLPHWEGKHCSNVQYASDGTKFRGGMDKGEPMLFYRKSLCRAAQLVPKEEGVKSGLKGYMYTFPDDLLDNGKRNEENKCFCRQGKCLPEGLIDVTDCYYGFPIALSYPHFYKGDQVLFDKVEGLKPSKELHETRFWIEPKSGLPLDVSTKFQINMALEDITKITNTDKFANMYLPLLWFDIRMYALPQSLETRFRFYLNILPVVEQGGMFFSFILGIFLILFTVYRLTFKVMFKTFDQKKNIKIGTDIWMDNEKKRDKDSIYAPCEIPLNCDSTDSDQFDTERRPSGFLKTQSDRIRDLSFKLGDRVYDSVGSVRDKVKDELTHVKNIFKDSERKNSLIVNDDSNVNDAYKSDSDDATDYAKAYTRVKQDDDYTRASQDDDDRYLEVLDDGSGFDNPNLENVAFNQLNELDTVRTDDELIINID